MNEYQQQVVNLTLQAIRDEITSAINYAAMSTKIQGIEGDYDEIVEKLIEHGKEEFNDHYHQLLEFLTKFGYETQITDLMPDSEITNKLPDTVSEILAHHQKQEVSAIKLYMNLVNLAKKEGDVETCKFFLEIAQDEKRHFDEMAFFTKEKRILGEKY